MVDAVEADLRLGIFVNRRFLKIGLGAIVETTEEWGLTVA